MTLSPLYRYNSGLWHWCEQSRLASRGVATRHSPCESVLSLNSLFTHSFHMFAFLYIEAAKFTTKLIKDKMVLRPCFLFALMMIDTSNSTLLVPTLLNNPYAPCFLGPCESKKATKGWCLTRLWLRRTQSQAWFKRKKRWQESLTLLTLLADK